MQDPARPAADGVQSTPSHLRGRACPLRRPCTSRKPGWRRTRHAPVSATPRQMPRRPCTSRKPGWRQSCHAPVFATPRQMPRGPCTSRKRGWRRSCHAPVFATPRQMPRRPCTSRRPGRGQSCHAPVFATPRQMPRRPCTSRKPGRSRARHAPVFAKSGSRSRREGASQGRLPRGGGLVRSGAVCAVGRTRFGCTGAGAPAAGPWNAASPYAAAGMRRSRLPRRPVTALEKRIVSHRGAVSGATGTEAGQRLSTMSMDIQAHRNPARFAP
jgi:hypothetical protein